MSEHWGEDFAEKHAEELTKFLAEAVQHGYGSDEPAELLDDGHQRMSYGDTTRDADGTQHFWRYVDTWVGGEPYSGFTTITYDGKVCWTMTYWGEVLPGNDKHEIYKCLRTALQCPILFGLPLRGPYGYLPKELGYLNQICGDITKFKGEEIIIKPKQNNDAAIEVLADKLMFAPISVRRAAVSLVRDDADQCGCEIVYQMWYRGGFVDLF